MYKLGCLHHPRDVRALCNRALVDCLLYDQVTLTVTLTLSL